MTTSSGPILVPIGFAEQSIIALEQAVNIAKITDSELFLLSVVEEPTAMQKIFFNYKEDQENTKEDIRKKLESLQDEYCADLSRDSDCMVSVGKVYEKIVEVADMIGASLIVMGTDGTPKDTRKKFIGSNAYNVVRSAPCPVITIKGKEHQAGCDTIVLPLDLQKETREKVTTAIQYARFWNADIRVFSVLITDDEFIKNKLTRNLEQVEQFITEKGVSCKAELLHMPEDDNLVNGVLAYTQKVDADLIMIMTQQESDFTKYFLGSTARSIINESDVPVMSVRPVKKRDMTHYELQ
jgi:nucleotide-binding universal stress UspA family protein